jgi:hypothetical protein
VPGTGVDEYNAADLPVTSQWVSESVLPPLSAALAKQGLPATARADGEKAFIVRFGKRQLQFMCFAFKAFSAAVSGLPGIGTTWRDWRARAMSRLPLPTGLARGGR